jgi:tRNA(Ile)-lysidine synthase
MSLLKHFTDYISSKNLFLPTDKLLLAVSGGIDSVVLCELCRQARFDFAIAHCNFQLRGDDSERDEKFVRVLAKKNNVVFYSIKFETKRVASEKKISVQEAARELRYNWFEELRKEGNYNYVLTAHHADDNIETVLMNFFRGTGIKGLKGIEPKHDHIVRPLLFARRHQLEEFLKSNNLEYVADVSNLSDDYTRNYFRNQVIPMVQQVFPEVNENILGNIERHREAEQLYRQAVSMHKRKLLELKGNEIHIPVLKLKKTEPLHTVCYEIVREYGFSPPQVAEIIALLDSDSGKYIRSASHRIIKNRNWLIIAPLEVEKAGIIIIDGPGSWQSPAGTLKIEEVSNTNQGSHLKQVSNFQSCIDAREIKFPLILRTWKQGDYFYPLGMTKKKKLARFFIDAKLSKTEKERVYVVEMDKKIIWVVGHRIDDRFKVTDKTKSILRLSFTQT